MYSFGRKNSAYGIGADWAKIGSACSVRKHQVSGIHSLDGLFRSGEEWYSLHSPSKFSHNAVHVKMHHIEMAVCIAIQVFLQRWQCARTYHLYAECWGGYGIG